jgi:XTP/dITP diphosphohydrolase
VKAVLASRNRHKLEQITALLPMIDLIPIDEVAPNLPLPEPYPTFIDNALSKARAAAQATGMSSVADDSGLEVEVLGGAPGVFSARWSGEGATDATNNAKLVETLRSLGLQEAPCRYRCVAALVWPTGEEVTAEGFLAGRVVLEGRGTGGFGYDPHVVPEGETRTMGEIPLEEKLRFNHRARAFRALADKIK